MRALRLLLPAAAALAAAGPALSDDRPLGAGERIAVARFKEVRAIGPAFAQHSWEGFNPADYPAVICEPEGWAVAAGFPEPPPGFTPLGEAKEGGPVYFRAAPGAFACEGPSPRRVGGRWAVISRFARPDPMPTGSSLGRRSAEEDLADHVGDAFLIFLMQRRKLDQPHPQPSLAYPDSAELMALAAVEHRLLLQAVKMQFTERNLEEFHGLVRQLIAVRRARWRTMGEELAARERLVEDWEGLRLYTASLVHRHAASGAYDTTVIGDADPTFHTYGNSILLRLLLTNYPMTFVPSSPAVTAAQVALRACSLTFLLDRLDRQWRPKALKAERPIIDLIAEIVPLQPEEEASWLERAKKENAYQAALGLAREDLQRLARDRQEALGRLFPPGRRRLEIRLGGRPATLYQEDPATAAHLGEGRLLHRQSLEILTEGLELRARSGPSSPGALLLTKAGGRREELLEVIAPLADDAEVLVAGKTFRPRKEGNRALTPESPLLVRSGGLEVQATRGTLRATPAGDLVLEIP